MWVFYFFRLSRRFLRLDKMNLFYVEEKEESIIFYQSKIYSYTNFEGLKKIGKLKSGRNILHNAAAKTPSNKLIFGEYFGNDENTPVNIYSIDLETKELKVLYTFEKGTIRHVHSCFWDKFSERVWVFTGDSDEECKILAANENFDEVNVIGEGSQDWRAVSSFFTKDSVYWLMDSPLETSRLVKYDRKNLHDFPSSRISLTNLLFLKL